MTRSGAITRWLNELAFAPFDYQPDAPADEFVRIERIKIDRLGTMGTDDSVKHVRVVGYDSHTQAFCFEPHCRSYSSETYDSKSLILQSENGFRIIRHIFPVKRGQKGFFLPHRPVQMHQSAVQGHHQSNGLV